MEKKYKLTDEIIEFDGITLHRIEALRSFGNVSAGDKGGWVEKEENLSHFFNAWVCGDAEVYGDAKVYGNAWVCGDAEVYGDAKVYGNAKVSENAKVFGNVKVWGNAEVCGDAKIQSNNDYIVFKNHFSSGRYFTYTSSNNMWKVGCFYGTGEELIAKAKKDSEEKAMYYEAYVNFVKQLESLDEKQVKNKSFLDKIKSLFKTKPLW